MSLKMKKLPIITIFLVCCVTGIMFGANGDEDPGNASQADTEKATEKAVEKAAEKAVEKAVEKVTEETVEKVAEKAVEKAEEKAAEKAELKAKRPEEWWETTKIHFFVFVVDIDSIDGAGQSFTTNVYVRLRWKDSRLAHEGSIRTVSLAETWNPRVIIANKGGLMQKSLPEVVEIERDGTITYHQRYTVVSAA